jgi:sugar phosphate isomerase/epimerase
MHRRSFIQATAAAALAPRLVNAASFQQSNPSEATQHKAHFQAGICCYSYREALGKKQMTYDDVIQQAVAMNLQTVDLTVYWLKRDDHDEIRQLRRSLYHNGLHWSGIAAHIEFTGETADARQKQLEDGKRWVDFANEVGASHVRIFGGNKPKNMSEEQIRPYVVEGMKSLADYSGQAGILLGIENDYGVTQKSDQVLYYVKAVNSPWLGLNVDTYNSPEDSYVVVERLMPYATHVHMKQGGHDAQGREVPTDWSRLFKLFQAAGYRGSVSLEYEGKEKPEEAIPRLGRELSRLVEQFNS